MLTLVNRWSPTLRTLAFPPSSLRARFLGLEGHHCLASFWGKVGASWLKSTAVSLSNSWVCPMCLDETLSAIFGRNIKSIMINCMRHTILVPSLDYWRVFLCQGGQFECVGSGEGTVIRSRVELQPGVYVSVQVSESTWATITILSTTYVLHFPLKLSRHPSDSEHILMDFSYSAIYLLCSP